MSMGRNWSSLAWMTTTQKFPPPNKMVYLTLCLWEEIGLVWSGSTIAKIPSTEQDGVFNIMSMGRNWSSLAWMTTNFNTFVLFFFVLKKWLELYINWHHTIGFKVMSMGRNESSLAWMTTTTT